MIAAMLFSAFLTVLPALSPGDAAVSSGDVQQPVIQEEIQEVIPDQVVQDNNIDVSVLSDSLEQINEKLDTVVMSVSPSVDAYQVSEYYQNYFAGVLQNMPYTEYLCYAERVYTGSSGYNNYVTHYYLLYDLQLQDGEIVPGTYPCIDVYNQDSVYYLNQTTKTFEGYPTSGFASFAPYSALIDRSFDFRSLYVGLICVMVFYIISRKHIYS